MNNTTAIPIDIINSDTRLTMKQKKEFVKIVSILQEFLPKHPSSPWPKEIRTCQQAGLISILLVAFDGTCGVSVRSGILYWNIIHYIFRKWVAGMGPSQKEIYRAIADYHFDNEPITKDVKDLEEILFRYGYRPWIRIKLGDESYTVLSQDLLRMTALAKRLGGKSVELEKAERLGQFGCGETTLLTFYIKNTGVNFHILCPPES